MSTTIESLELEIKSNSTNAVNGIEALAQSLGQLKNATKGGLGLKSIANNIDAVGKSVNNINPSGANALKGLADAIKTLSGVKVSPTIGSNITAISTALNGLKIEGAGNALKIQELVSALEPLSQLPKSNLSSVITPLEKIPKVMKELNQVDMGGFAAKILEVTNAVKPLATEMEKVSNGFAKFPTQINKVTSSMNSLSSANNKGAASFLMLAGKITIVFQSIKKAVSSIGKFIKKSSDYIENVNLFSVSMGQYANEARAYAETVGEVMGIDPGEWMRNQGVFQTLATGFGVAGDKAAVMSKNLTQLGYDISSFYNLDVGDAMEKLQSGLAGELEPLRRIGYDLSQAKLEATAAELGIDKAVSSMTQAEKAMLRYHAIMTQVTTVHGDMARTLDAPANQTRILKAQLEQLARAIGNIFIPLLNKVIPYLIAATKVLTEMVSSVASLVGFEMPEVDYSGVDTVVTGGEDASDALDDASESAKKLKSYMMGFDELNVISPNDDSSSSGLGDISQFDFELPEYDFLSEAVDTKVSKIVEKMKEWLGVTGEITSWSDLLHTRLGKIATAVGVVAGAFKLWKISNKFIKGFKTISSLFGKKGIGKLGGSSGISSPKTILKAMANIGIIVGGVITLVATVGLLTKIPGFNETIHEGLSAVGTVFKELLPVVPHIAAISAGVVLLGKVDIKTVAKGFVNMAIIIDGVPAVITAIGALMSIPYFSDFLQTGIKSVVDAFNGLYDIAVPIGVLAAYITALGFVGASTVLSGLAGFALVIGGTEALIVAIGALMSIPYFSEFLATGITSLKTAFKALEEIAIPIGALSVLLIALGIASPTVILLGLAGFALVIAGLEAVLVALGALSQIPGFDWIVGEGAEALANLGNALGKFAGSIVGGFAEGVSDSFPKIGENIGAFMKNATPFFEGLENVNASSMSAVKDLALMVLTLTATDVLDGLTSWFTGGNSLGKFAEDLKEFAPDLVEYSNAVADVDVDAVKNSGIAADVIMAFADDVPNEGGVLGWIMGENNIDDFGAKLPAFGLYMTLYSKAVKGLDVDAVKNSGTAADVIIAFAKEIPNEGGVLGWIMGENNIDDFGKKLPAFGRYLVEYSEAVTGLKGDVVVKSTDAADAIIAIAKNIPNSDGVVAWFTGDNDIEDFGKKLPGFGANLKKYSDNVSGIKTDLVDKSTTAIGAVVAICGKIPKEGGIKAWFTGDNAIDDFGAKLAAFGYKFSEYYCYIMNISTSQVNGITDCIGEIIDFAIRIKNNVDIGKVNSFTDAMKNLGKAIKDLPTSKTIVVTVTQVAYEYVPGQGLVASKGTTGNLQLFAEGGFPASGQAFIARENGIPEMVGTIGRRTAVANNEQIVEAVSVGVAEANGEQNMLLREQNTLLRALLEKESGVYLDGRSLSNSVDKYKHERGRVLVTGGAL